MYIQAYVTEFQTKVPLSPDDQPDDLIIKAEYTDFLGLTRLDELRPSADLSMSIPGRYRELEEHISVHRYFMGIEQDREIPYQEAVTSWYDNVYMPVVRMIREQGILHDFPDRTETDLYLWIMKHRDELDQDLAWEIRPEVAADDLVDRSSPRLKRIINRVVEKIRSIIIPKKVASGPPPGEWRRERGVEEPKERLFTSILVAINGQESGWQAVEQAIEVARREGGRLIGMHVVPASSKEDRAVQAVRQEFDRRCAKAGITAQWVLETGEVASKICERGRWLDLVVVSLVYPPDDQPAARLESGFRALVQRCPTPVLAVPDVPSAMSRALLAYDGSPKAQEALFVSTYLAGQWGVPLAVVTVLEQEHTTSETAKRALKYLEEHGVEAALVKKHGAIGGAILSAAAEQESDLIIMGGYGFSPVLQIVLGSAVDQVLRESRVPVLICR
jgi:nucleotide-binding universal stress UspA family protein